MRMLCSCAAVHLMVTIHCVSRSRALGQSVRYRPVYTETCTYTNFLNVQDVVSVLVGPCWDGAMVFVVFILFHGRIRGMYTNPKKTSVNQFSHFQLLVIVLMKISHILDVLEFFFVLRYTKATQNAHYSCWWLMGKTNGHDRAELFPRCAVIQL